MMMPVKIIKGQNTQLANPVTFRIYLLTVAAVLGRSLDVPADAQMMTPDSPVQASTILILLENFILLSLFFISCIQFWGIFL